MKEVRIESRLVNKGHYVPGMISGEQVVQELEIACRGRLQ